MSAAILVLNAGSSSIKFALYSSDPGNDRPYVRGDIGGIGHTARMKAQDADGKSVIDLPIENATHSDALSRLLEWITKYANGTDLVATGHRVVHGGIDFTAAVRITPELLRKLEALSPLAPLHQPHNLAAVRTLAQTHPEMPQIACFDTAFHAAQPTVATTFALPYELTAKGVRRYGFHGLSYDYIAGVLPEHLGAKADGKIVVAHLGHGASMCAMLRRQSVATTMGFSALDGLMMGSRCGSLDPGVILYLLDQERMGSKEIVPLLYQRSGLLGVSGISDDMRELLVSTNDRAAFAIELFVYRIARELGSLVAALGGLDALVFTGGIGEHSPEIRARVCKQAMWTGVRLDEVANAAGSKRINHKETSVDVFALPTNEEWIIARDCRSLL